MPNVTTCLHKGEKTDVVKTANVTCEEVWTYCDACGEVIETRIDC